MARMDVVPAVRRGTLGQVDRTAFAAALLQVMRSGGDLGSEETWQRLGELLAEYWLVFQTDQSPMATWAMLGKCGEMKLKIRATQKGEKGSSGAEALEEFRGMMREVVGEAANDVEGEAG